MPGQSIKPFGDIHQQIQLPVLLAVASKASKLWFFTHCLSKISSREAPHILGNIVNLFIVQPKRQTAITDRSATAVGGLH